MRDASKAILIAGPTASGKSALALAIAERVGGVIINADSMQVYRELRILSARPTPEEEARVPHKLYGFVPAGEAYSAGRFVRDATACDCCGSQRRPSSHHRRRHRSLFQGAARGPVADPADR